MTASEWYAFGAKLSIPTYLIQLLGSKDEKTIERISEVTFDVVRDCFAKQKQFYIIGHSFGAILAIQLAQMLERNGATGHVLLIDGSPVYLKRMSEAMIKTTSKKQNTEDVLIMLVYFNVCNSERSYRFAMQLQGCNTWSMKMDLLYRQLPEAMKNLYSADYLYATICAMSNRLNAVLSMNVDADNVKLKSPVMLIRPKQASFTDIADDYGLSNYAEQPVDVRYIQGNHLTMLDGDEIIRLIEDFAPSEWIASSLLDSWVCSIHQKQ